MVVADPDDDSPLPVGVVGEILVRAPQVMAGYLDDPEATAAALRGGWLHTGDIAYYNDEKQFFIVDRLKELIKVRGYQVTHLVNRLIALYKVNNKSLERRGY